MFAAAASVSLSPNVLLWPNFLEAISVLSLQGVPRVVLPPPLLDGRGLRVPELLRARHGLRNFVPCVLQPVKDVVCQFLQCKERSATK